MACKNMILEPYPSVDFGVLSCSPLRDVKTLGFLKEHHSRTQIWGFNLSDKGVCLILRVYIYIYIYMYVYIYICIYIYISDDNWNFP